ncbi:MAG: methylenetetrahydrofolate reductase [Bacillota bacterium]|nr:methylenetetrahydrofolate reductase [Bacillota bacterium]
MIQGKTIAVELDPPKTGDDRKTMSTVEQLQAWGIDVITFADSPGGNPRADSVAMGIKVRNHYGIETIPHICCRDQNKIGLRSRIMGGYLNGIRRFLFVTGDPVPSGKRDDVKAVFNCNSISLMALAQELNETIFTESPLVYGGAVNYDHRKVEVEAKRLGDKASFGATFFMTQPVYCEKDLEKVLTITGHTEAPVLLGLMPLLSKRNAFVIKEQIRGIAVPDDVVSKFTEGLSLEDTAALSAEILRPIVEASWNRVSGYYLVGQKNHLEPLCKTLEIIYNYSM